MCDQAISSLAVAPVDLELQEMRRLLALLAPLFCVAVAWTLVVPATQAAENLQAGLQAVQDEDWAEALRLARRDGQIAEDIVEWHRLRAGRGTYDQVMDFLDRRGDWPGLEWLVRKSEPAFADAPTAAIRAMFATRAPQTAEGVYIHARALRAAGQVGEADAGLVLAWRTLPMGSVVPPSWSCSPRRSARELTEVDTR
ncbi:MAG: hypothetical protein AAFR45_09585, partial [Pseudomonadota bacterium]